MVYFGTTKKIGKKSKKTLSPLPVVAFISYLCRPIAKGAYLPL